MIRHYKNLTLAALIVTSGILISAGVASKCPHEASVQLERQNVLYIGVDNPIFVTVSGIAPGKVIVETNNGTITPTARPGGFILKVDSLNKTTITVSYREGGTVISAGLYEYRNKKVPDPRTYIGSYRSEGVYLKSDLQNITGVFTRMENFDFDCAFKPQSFSMSVVENGAWKEYQAAGPELTPEMKIALTKCEKEDKILFHNVMTKGPAGDVRLTNCVMITVK